MSLSYGCDSYGPGLCKFLCVALIKALVYSLLLIICSYSFDLSIATRSYYGVWDQINPDAPPRPNPMSEAPAIPDLDTADSEALRLYQIKASIYTQLSSRLQVLWNWVYTTVDSQLLELATLQASDYDDDWKEQSPAYWLLEWTRAHANAKLVNLEDIKGALPIKDFLRSAAKYDHEWAQRELDSLARPGATTNALTLEQYAAWFSQLVQNKEKGLGHLWKLIHCGRLEYTIKGRTDRELRNPPTDKEIAQIKERLESAQYSSLRDALAKKGWISKHYGMSSVRTSWIRMASLTARRAQTLWIRSGRTGSMLDEASLVFSHVLTALSYDGYPAFFSLLAALSKIFWLLCLRIVLLCSLSAPLVTLGELGGVSRKRAHGPGVAPVFRTSSLRHLAPELPLHRQAPYEPLIVNRLAPHCSLISASHSQ
ncbi:uncharacterized protein BDR25DRAFT_360601 [Lindgomyces ingoldianus]|uniref:Uncharacterized protein n=1 Tax=Lindgomyces ingoldianus TaxID=673940 RepID=A0ACB6QEA9_9PLEO|nr:uncharacterized protein BDR25DRAFT_360601 [Lindgomyces ingoldianus]KAF2465249.1 hypothetical protein BDR25DRAFT_360601 [Lindgomyces ingoldianus]